MFLPFLSAQENLSSMLESWVYHDDELNKDDCPETSNVTHSSFIAVPGSAIATTISSILGPMVSLPMTDTASLITSMCGPIGSAWDTLSSTSRIPGFSARDPVSAAAHLHLLGESLYLIGHHLKDTNVSRSCIENLCSDRTKRYRPAVSRYPSVCTPFLSFLRLPKQLMHVTTTLPLNLDDTVNEI